MFFLRPLGLVPSWLRYWLSDVFAFVLLYIAGYRKYIVNKNWADTLGKGVGPSRREVWEIYRNLTDTMLEAPWMLAASKATLKKALVVPIQDLAMIRQVLAVYPHAVVATSHIGNWELTAQTLALHEVGTSLIVYKPLLNKRSQPQADRIRTRFGALIAPMKLLPKRLAEAQLTHKNVLVGLAAEQRPQPNETNYWTTFLGKEAAFYTGPAKLALRKDMPIFYMNGRRVARGKYEVRFELLYSPEQASDFTVESLTELLIKRAEQHICSQPTSWLWTHNRWKHTRPRHQRKSIA